VGNLNFFGKFLGFYQGTIVGVGSPKFVRLAFTKRIFWTRIPKGQIKMHNGNMLVNIMTKVWRFNTIILTMIFPWSLKNAPTFNYWKIPIDFNLNSNKLMIKKSRFVLKILWCGQSGNHPKNILAKFDYMLDMKIGKKYFFKFLANYWNSS